MMTGTCRALVMHMNGNVRTPAGLFLLQSQTTSPILFSVRVTDPDCSIPEANLPGAYEEAGGRAVSGDVYGKVSHLFHAHNMSTW